jgi:serine/threonine protein kinase
MPLYPAQPDRPSRSVSPPASPKQEQVETPTNFTVTPDPSEKVTIDFSPPKELEFSGIEFGKYLILEKIARGGMGVVFKARDNTLGRVVALKVIRSGLLAGDHEIKRFYQEAQVVAQLNHRHIIKIYDFGQVKGQYYFTMGLAEGSLVGQLKRFGEKPFLAATLLSKIAQAVHHIHNNKLLHRDLKPGNILLEAGDEPLVSDFGLAKSTQPDSDLTRPGDAPGTLLYMAPEQAGRRNQDVDCRTDVWALGVILYEMLCGQKPFTGANDQEIANAIQFINPPRPRLLRKGLDVSLETIVLKCLEKEPSHRYSTAGELAEDLDRWVRGEPIQARPFPWWKKVLRFAKRRPVFSILLTLFLIGISGLPWALAYFDPEKPVKEEILPRLMERQTVFLIPENEDPLWFRWRLPGVIGAKRQGKGPFNINSGAPCLLELLPRVPLDQFRYQAEIKLDTSASGDPGICLSYVYHPGEVHSFILFGFSPSQNSVFAKLVHYSPVNWQSQRSVPLFHADYDFKEPAWYQLIVEITPDKISFTFQDKLLHSCPQKRLADYGSRLIMSRPDLPGVQYDFSIHNGLGLYLTKGSASFQNVVVEPF